LASPAAARRGNCRTSGPQPHARATAARRDGVSPAPERVRDATPGSGCGASAGQTRASGSDPRRRRPDVDSTPVTSTRRRPVQRAAGLVTAALVALVPLAAAAPVTAVEPAPAVPLTEPPPAAVLPSTTSPSYFDTP